MEDNAKCFIKIRKGYYEEITYKELKERRENDNTYINKKFIPIQKTLIEVSLEEYKDFYKEIERNKYIKKKNKIIGKNKKLLGVINWTSNCLWLYCF